jgi:hypothetical protein
MVCVLLPFIRCVNSSSMSSTWRIFSYKELHAATNGFSEENKLGEGGFGSVYWGKTSDGLQVIHVTALTFLLTGSRACMHGLMRFCRT